MIIIKAQNNRELSFRKGDVIYIKKQVDNNWYEGERNNTVGIFPVTYVEILPNNTDVSETKYWNIDAFTNNYICRFLQWLEKRKLAKGKQKLNSISLHKLQWNYQWSKVK